MKHNRPSVFIGRSEEMRHLRDIGARGGSAIIVVHGRRRVGKTSLIENAYHDRGMIKLEGLESAARSNKEQIYNVVQQLAQQFPNRSIEAWRPKTWGDFFRALAPMIASGTWTLFLEEYQWLAGYRSALTAELKLAWDNELSRNPKLLVVLCGSSPAFMVGNVLRSKALHNRSMHEIKVGPLPYVDARKLLTRQVSLKESFDAYLLVGGIPEYVKRLNAKSSVYTSLCAEAFLPTGFFVDELNRITVSSLAENQNYIKVLSFLGHSRFATRLEIAKYLKVTPGGTLSSLLGDLESSGFIASYSPVNKAEGSLLDRYTLSDPFLRLYFQQIHPKVRAIRRGDFRGNTARALTTDELSSILGLEFEALCRRNSAAIARHLSFGSVESRSGAYFSRVLERQQKAFQLDLVFQRSDKVHTVCEIKYTREPVGKEIIPAYERALALYRTQFPNNSIHRVLIASAGASKELLRERAFDDVITLEQLIAAL